MSVLINLCTNSVSNNLGEWEKLLERLGGSFKGIEESVWENIRFSKEIPHVGNAYTYELFLRLFGVINNYDNSLDVDWYINGSDSHFYVNKTEISNEDDFFSVVEELGKVA